MRGAWSEPGLIGLLACIATAVQPECRSSANCETADHLKTGNSHYFYVNGSIENKEQQVIVTSIGDSISLCCDCHDRDKGHKLSIDDSSLPLMSSPLIVKNVFIKGCTVPINGSYYKALRDLNIIFKSKERGNVLSLDDLPPEPQLEGYHLDELPIEKLLITAYDINHPTRPKFNFLDKLPNLKILQIQRGVVPEKEAIGRLPTTLENLILKNTHLPDAECELGNGSFWLERLHSLKYLYIWESSTHSKGSIRKTLLPPPFASLPNLTNATLFNVPLAPLPEKTPWLKGSNLRSLQMISCGLVKLPVNMFEGVNITKLWLTNNNLTSLPEGVFTPLEWLAELNLSDNKLDSKSLKLAVERLRVLQTLKVNNNPLGSLCGGDSDIQGTEESGLPSTLRFLELSRTGARRICDDWLQNDALMHISLTNNNISNLSYNELLMMRREVKNQVVLDLRNNLLRKIDITEKDFNLCMNDSRRTNWGSHKRARVYLYLNELSCDCDAYWLAKTLRSCSLLKADTVPCAPRPPASAPRTLNNYDPRDITCDYEGLCAPGCACRRRAFDNATVMRCAGALPPESQWPPAESGWPLALHVAPGTLTAVPQDLALVELHAPNNNITSIDFIPDTLRVLDATNNRISRISESAAKQLLLQSAKSGYHVSLAGNKLACACDDARAIMNLKDAKIMDWNIIQCVDGVRINRKTTGEMCDNKFLLPLLIVLGTLFILTLLVVFTHYQLPNIRQFLFDHNMCLKWVLGVNDDADDPMKTHDVFISYSYDDYEYAKKLIEKLEEHGHSTIEHCRDWLPGKSVSQQITHSVMSARRTLLLVTDSYANSKWGLEEFHAAHAHAMERGSARVIVIRCKLLAPQELPPDLQLYLYNNTYLDWSDRDFWNKLRRVLPTPRAVPTPGIALLHSQEAPPSIGIQATLQATTVPALQLSGNKELPLSELVLIPPVSDTASLSKHGQNKSQRRSLLIAPVARIPPPSSARISPISQRIQRDALTAPVVSTAVSPCAC